MRAWWRPCNADSHVSAAISLFGASAAAALGYAAISALVAEKKTSKEDAKARRKIVERSTRRAKKLAEATGHIGKTTAVAITSAWVLAREGIASGWGTAPAAAALAAVSGLGRLVLDRHWSTDSAAGYCAGIALGCACAGAYEVTSRRI